ncbi:39S ribosomal protein L52, mitochondrial isoform X2 [Canis lupus familiaris]|uniref:uncharacterized protein LOC118355451 isoform X3 n=1 Tax=Canis lupus dingo TaxID=286419 RepID=UPI0015F16D07|nr:uncharacterized protein LOC118355451 isoform X3 [Canis lupus dingo]XP_038400089.1 39S ribosomal protein L52, mitochondrial isoform X2 [Canis lupus familiaris]XP_038439197.1 39S ribosomal protein L52, mitochondrial isoform X2 [Canis lupus familiaris]XP_038529014.1 39S ribosomal protein L52, mitochondrial isoform X2 [Canis lupus familiaris]
MAPHPGATAGEMDPKTQRTQRRRAEARKSLKHPQVPGSAEQETGAARSSWLSTFRDKKALSGISFVSAAPGLRRNDGGQVQFLQPQGSWPGGPNPVAPRGGPSALMEHKGKERGGDEGRGDRERAGSTGEPRRVWNLGGISVPDTQHPIFFLPEEPAHSLGAWLLLQAQVRRHFLPQTPGVLPS